MRLTDSIVAGAVGRMGFTVVENSTLSYQPVDSQQPSQSGAWSVDTGISAWSANDIMSRQDIPDYDDATLAGIWTW